MFCPRCGYEYRPGFAHCSDCHVSLVDTFPDSSDKKQEDVKFVNLLSTFDHGDIAVIKSIFEAEGITYFIHGEHAFNQVQFMAGPVWFMVREDQVQEAVEVLRDLDLQFNF